MIVPTPENYDKIPQLYKPTMGQTTTSHSAVVEFCPIPMLREALCRHHRDFLPILAKGISCNWLYTEETCLETNSNNGNVLLTDAFCLHILNPENWTVRSDTFDMFPECLGQIHTTY